MAKLDITIDLKGGDNQTANGDLQVQLLDVDNGDAIIATANYAAIGSNNNNGTDGANITYTLDNVANGGDGELLLEGVEIGNVTNIKVQVRDELQNESFASAAYDLSGGGGGTFQPVVFDMTAFADPENTDGQLNVALVSANRYQNTAGNWASGLISANTLLPAVGETKRYRMDVLNEGSSADSHMIGLSLTPSNRTFQTVDYCAYTNNNSTVTVRDSASTVAANGNAAIVRAETGHLEYRLINVAGTITVYLFWVNNLDVDQLVHEFATKLSGAAYMWGACGYASEFSQGYEYL